MYLAFSHQFMKFRIPLQRYLILGKNDFDYDSNYLGLFLKEEVLYISISPSSILFLII